VYKQSLKPFQAGLFQETDTYLPGMALAKIDQREPGFYTRLSLIWRAN
jgi:hypothetical protein